MFADAYDAPWKNRSRRAWTTLMSFLLQAMALSATLLLSLFCTDSLPQLRRIVDLGVLPPHAPDPPRPTVQSHSRAVPQSNMAGRIMLIPTQIPRGIARIVETEAPPSVASAVPYAPGGTSEAGPSGVPFAIGRSMSPVIPRAPVTRTPVTSYSMEAYHLHRVQPGYPPLAKTAHIQGLVVVQAIIAKDGTIENLRVVSGHPMLVPAAIEAIRQWRYRPYFLNGEAVEVETQVTVNFVLNGG